MTCHENLKGEITLVVAGNEEKDKGTLGKKLQKKIEKLIRQNKIGIREIASRLSDETGISYRKIYRECLAMKRFMDNDSC